MAFSELTDKQRELAELMSDLSEAAYCAGWLIGLEDALWKMVVTGDGTKFGDSYVEPETIAKLKSLSDEIGGWIVWDPRDTGDNETFVPMAEWLEMAK